MDNDQRSALQSAAWQGHMEIVRMLLEQGAIVDHTCNQGATALCIAAQEGHEQVVRVLLEFGANSDHADQFNRTAMRVALKNGHADVVKLLENFNAIQNNVNKQFAGSNSTTSVTSLSTAETKVCSAVLGMPSTGAFESSFLGESPGFHPESDKRQSYVSNQSSSKSSSNLTNSTNKSATRPEVNYTGTQRSTTSVGSGKSNKTSDSLSFTQQLQQCSLNKNRPLSRLLSPLSEPQSPPQSPVSDNQGSPPPTPPPRSLHSRLNPIIPQDQDLPLKSMEEPTRTSSNDKIRRNGIVTNPNYIAVNTPGNILNSSGARNKQMMSNYDTPAPRPVNYSKKETPL